MSPIQNEKIFTEVIANSQDLLNTVINYLLSSVVANVDLSSLTSIAQFLGLGKRDLAQQRVLEDLLALAQGALQQFLGNLDLSAVLGQLLGQLGK